MAIPDTIVPYDEANKQRCKRAGRMGGVYLESIGEFDVRKLTDEQWEAFIWSICAEFEIPF